MLITKHFSFNRKGELTIFADRISLRNLAKIIRMCVWHARFKKIKKPCKWRMVSTLCDAV